MARYRNYWYYPVRNMIEHCLDDRYEPVAPMEYCIDKAIKAALSKTGLMDDGVERIALVNMVYHKKSHTVAGAGMRLHVCERTAQQWNSDFIYAVAQEAGFISKDCESQTKNRIS